jgi:hypothetical protein
MNAFLFGKMIAKPAPRYFQLTMTRDADAQAANSPLPCQNFDSHVLRYHRAEKDRVKSMGIFRVLWRFNHFLVDPTYHRATANALRHMEDSRSSVSTFLNVHRDELDRER